MDNTVGCIVVYNQFRKTENRFRVDKGKNFYNSCEKYLPNTTIMVAKPKCMGFQPILISGKFLKNKDATKHNRLLYCN